MRSQTRAPNPETLPAGVDATVRAEGMLTITVKATDADGDPLYCKWKAKANAGGQSGSFSSANGEDRMEWSYAEQKWISIMEWKPPSGAKEGERFTLTCDIEDRRSGKNTAEKVAEIVGGKIAFSSSRDGNYEIYVTNADGSSPKNLTNSGASDAEPAWSPDGAKIDF